MPVLTTQAFHAWKSLDVALCAEWIVNHIISSSSSNCASSRVSLAMCHSCVFGHGIFEFLKAGVNMNLSEILGSLKRA